MPFLVSLPRLPTSQTSRRGSRSGVSSTRSTTTSAPAASGSFGLAALRSIVSWKSEKRFKASNDVKIVNYNTVNPGLIVAITGAALAGGTDGAALAALLGIPVAQGPPFGKRRPNAGDPNRWTVFDRMANTSLRKMSAVLALRRPAGLQRVALALAALPIPAGNVAVAANWPAYMKCCREISAITWLSLRTVDPRHCMRLGELEGEPTNFGTLPGRSCKPAKGLRVLAAAVGAFVARPGSEHAFPECRAAV